MQLLPVDSENERFALRNCKVLPQCACQALKDKGLWGSLAILSGLGPDDLGSNPSSPIIIIEEIKMASKYSGAVKRFGARYGKRVRERLSKVESQAKSRHKCPYCSYIAVRKESVGIFHCTKCDAKFTGKAFSPVKQKVKKQQKVTEKKFDDELFAKKEKKKGEDDEFAQEAEKSIKEMEKGETPEEEQELLE